MYLHAMAIHK